MSPIAETSTLRERSADSIVALTRRIDDLLSKVEYLSDLCEAQSNELFRLTATFALPEVAEVLEQYGVKATKYTPVSSLIYDFVVTHPDWWNRGVLNSIGGEHVKLIADTGIVLTVKGRAAVFDALVSDDWGTQ